MAELHALLAAEKVPKSAWDTLREETKKKFGNLQFFTGHTKTLKMLADSDANQAIEAAARDQKPVTTTVYDTLEYALQIFGRSEDLQYQKNATNRIATADVEFKGDVILHDMPVDELMGLEVRLTAIKEIILAVPTLDASRDWERAPGVNSYIWRSTNEDVTTKTEKTMTPVVLYEATVEHPAQVKEASRDIVIGRFTTRHLSGACRTMEKAEAIQNIDLLIEEIKKARMRANSTKVVAGHVSDILIPLILAPFKKEAFSVAA